MAVQKVRKMLRKGLSIALAAAVMATSAPQLSVTAMAQEEGQLLQEQTSEETASEVTEPEETQQEGSEGQETSRENVSNEDSVDENAENIGGGK